MSWTSRTARVIGAVLLLIATIVVVIVRYFPPSGSSRSSPSASAIQFRTLPPGAELPSGAQCARWVRESPSPENRPSNKTFNDTTGQHVAPGFFPAGDSPQAKTLAPGSAVTSPARPRKSCAGRPASGASARTSSWPRPQSKVGGGKTTSATGERRPSFARRAMASGLTAGRASARRVTASYRPDIHTRKRAGRALACRQR